MSASMLDVDFGTCRGWGEPLTEETPFCTLLTLLLVPDSLCTQCLARLDVLDFKPEVLTLGLSQDSNGCRLCALLLARFRATAAATASVIEIEYRMKSRYGYFLRVFDIVFRTVGAKDWGTNVVRLAIQKAKLDRDVDHDHPPMVYFESKISLSTDSESSMAQVMKWFETCCEKHECKPQNSPAPFVPSRLLEISGSDEGTMRIRLRERQTLPVEVRYATLSHCCGSVMPFKLKHEILESCLNGISLDEISRVFRDAIRVAWRLKIQYIWIDSLCIIQDSREDWSAESAQMGFVYRHGVLNIAATGFSDGSNGLFVQRDPNLLTPISFSMGTNHSSHDNYYLADTRVWKDGVDDSPLCGRGWVTQERALSVRTVHFGKEQLFWECLCENASEVLPKGMLRGTVGRVEDRATLGKLGRVPPDPSDKLVAISGMAQTLAPKLNYDYLAGLWRKDLEHQLLWKVTQPRPAPEKDHTRGPSWTWASVDGAIDIPDWSGYFYDGIAGDVTWMAKVDGASVRLAETGKYGHARSGILTLTGRLGVLRIVKNEPENSVSANGSPESKRLWIRASWDTQELAEKFSASGPRTYVQYHSTYSTKKGARRSMHPLDIFFAPVRVMDADPNGYDCEQPMLTGLLLLPTRNKKGTFRRVGQFELSRVWIHPHEEAFKSLSKSTVLLDDRLYISRHIKCG